MGLVGMEDPKLRYIPSQEKYIERGSLEDIKSNDRAKGHIRDVVPPEMQKYIKLPSVSALTDNTTTFRLDANKDTHRFYESQQKLPGGFYMVPVLNEKKEITAYEVVISKKMDKASAAELSKEDDQLQKVSKDRPELFMEDGLLSPHAFKVQEKIFESAGYKKNSIFAGYSHVDPKSGKYIVSAQATGLPGKKISIHSNDPYVSAGDVLRAVNDSKATGKEDFYL